MPWSRAMIQATVCIQRAPDGRGSRMVWAVWVAQEPCCWVVAGLCVWAPVALPWCEPGVQVDSEDDPAAPCGVPAAAGLGGWRAGVGWLAGVCVAFEL